MKKQFALSAVLAALAFSVAIPAIAGRCDGNQGNGNGNICTPAPTPTPAPAETDRQYTARVHGYAHGNSVAINHLDKRQEVTEAKTAGNREYIERVHSYANGNTLGIQHLSRRDASQQVQIDGLGAGHSSQQSQIDGLGAEIDVLGSRMGSELSALRDEVREAREGSAVALAVAGQQFDTSAGFQVALSASTMAGEQAIAVGAGGAISERVFVNAAYAQSGRTRGGVVSSTFKF